MSEQKNASYVQDTIKRIALALKILGIYDAVVGASLIALTFSIASSGKPFDAATFLAGLLALTLGVLMYTASNALKEKKPWAYKAAAAYCILVLLSFPIGTIAGGMVLYWLSRPGVPSEFKKKK